ncbi:uncharacterized protein PAC_12734 [Phialocephala subalpina]|uniref:Uncharacterized protein n=1 Tax=Phialocephala subalpina TaxID=576137 RepID=A0A1L7XCZ3_9HELO|nr:uncharacterized protein PAC_12734 [Phialocephala subalpina]
MFSPCNGFGPTLSVQPGIATTLRIILQAFPPPSSTTLDLHPFLECLSRRPTPGTATNVGMDQTLQYMTLPAPIVSVGQAKTQGSNLAAGQPLHTITLPPSDLVQKKRRRANEPSLLLGLQTPRDAINSTSTDIPDISRRNLTKMDLCTHKLCERRSGVELTKPDSRDFFQQFKVLSSIDEQLPRPGVGKLPRHGSVKFFWALNQVTILKSQAPRTIG